MRCRLPNPTALIFLLIDLFWHASRHVRVITCDSSALVLAFAIGKYSKKRSVPILDSLFKYLCTNNARERQWSSQLPSSQLYIHQITVSSVPNNRK
jgi:hypothetical protein